MVSLTLPTSYDGTLDSRCEPQHVPILGLRSSDGRRSRGAGQRGSLTIPEPGALALLMIGAGTWVAAMARCCRGRPSASSSGLRRGTWPSGRPGIPSF